MPGFPQPAFTPCSECGASVPNKELAEHVCEQERWLDYQLHVQLAELERFEDDLGAYFDSPEGRFQQWDAERRREAEEPDAG
jgi:hypothetical protein